MHFDLVLLVWEYTVFVHNSSGTVCYIKVLWIIYCLIFCFVTRMAGMMSCHRPELWYNWLCGTVVERHFWPVSFPYPALDLQLTGNHLWVNSVSATSQPTRPTQPFILPRSIDKWVVSSNQMSATSLRVAPSGECLWGEGPVWLIGAVVCCYGGSNCPVSVIAGNGWPHLHCSTIGSCQSTATSEIAKTLFRFHVSSAT